MNINDLTIGQAKSLQELFSNNSSSSNNSMYSKFIGKYVICRTRNEGVNCGKVIDIDSTGVVLEDARRLYYHVPLQSNSCWYEGIAEHGISDESKVSTQRTKLIAEDYSLTICSEKAEKTLREITSYVAD